MKHKLRVIAGMGLLALAIIGWILPFISVTRDTSVCSPGVAPVHV